MSHIVLASTSPRRIDLLTQVGFKPEVIAPDADETQLRGEKPRALVSRLAREKAESVAAKTLATGKLPGVIIAADTIVVAPGGKLVLGKPRSTAEAKKMLSLLAGKTHTVLTGYCVLKLAPPKKKGSPFKTHIVVRVVTSKVKMRALSRQNIARYVATGEPMDKAGSYGAQGIGMSLIESLTGSYTNVVGLPICQLLLDLETKFGITP